MYELDTPVQISYKEGEMATVQLEIFFHGAPLHAARVAAAATRYVSFQARANAIYGKDLPDCKLATLIGHGQTTIKTALSSQCPKNGLCVQPRIEPSVASCISCLLPAAD